MWDSLCGLISPSPSTLGAKGRLVVFVLMAVEPRTRYAPTQPKGTLMGCFSSPLKSLCSYTCSEAPERVPSSQSACQAPGWGGVTVNCVQKCTPTPVNPQKPLQVLSLPSASEGPAASSLWDCE